MTTTNESQRSGTINEQTELIFDDIFGGYLKMIGDPEAAFDIFDGRYSFLCGVEEDVIHLRKWMPEMQTAFKRQIEALNERDECEAALLMGGAFMGISCLFANMITHFRDVETMRSEVGRLYGRAFDLKKSLPPQEDGETELIVKGGDND